MHKISKTRENYCLQWYKYTCWKPSEFHAKDLHMKVELVDGKTKAEKDMAYYSKGKKCSCLKKISRQKTIKVKD